jgi:hypothetical protein
MTLQLAAIPYLPVYRLTESIMSATLEARILISSLWCKVAPSDRSAGTVNWRPGTRHCTSERRHRGDETMLAALRTQLRSMR